ncbi:MAG: hypothetical protein Q8R12_03960, partial [bacterium]|nr:hypothetical protein [bacterium]
MGFLGLLLFSNAKLYQRRTNISDQVGTLRVQVDKLEQQNKKFRGRIEETASEGYLEKTARE